MKKIDNFINLYPLSKTLRFKLIPYGKTEYFFNERKLLEEDEKRAEEYIRAKEIMDECHKQFIEQALTGLNLIHLNEYIGLYYKNKRTNEENKRLEEVIVLLRKEISARFKDNSFKSDFDTLFKKELLDKAFEISENKKDREIISSFKGFFTYFYGYSENRRNMYTGEGKSTEIAFRLIDQNLPKYLDNCKNWEKTVAGIGKEYFYDAGSVLAERLHFSIFDDIIPENYCKVLTQSGIDAYNQIIGGYSLEDGTKVQGVNELINLYNQKKHTKYPKLKPLYKQILSDRTSESFVLDEYKTDEELKKECTYYFEDAEASVLSNIGKLKGIFERFASYKLDEVHMIFGAEITGLSKHIYGDWSVITKAFGEKYINLVKTTDKKAAKYTAEKFEEIKTSYLKSLKSVSVSEIESVVSEYAHLESEPISIADYYTEIVCAGVKNIEEAYEDMKRALSSCEDSKLVYNDQVIEKVKVCLDYVMNLYHEIKVLSGTGLEEWKDEFFYGDFMPVVDNLSSIIHLYNKVRNYVTKKPYSNEKIKLNFQNPQFLGGWDRNKEKDYSSVMLLKDGKYYLAVMDKEHKRVFEDTPSVSDGVISYRKMVYKLLPGPNKMLPKVFFSKKGLEEFKPSEDVLKIYKDESFKTSSKNFSLEDCHKLIDFYKDAINRHEDWSNFGFSFSDTASYRNIGEFFKEIQQQGYSIKFTDIPVPFIEELVESGKIYMFELYNKDFSEYSKGTPNLHTLYFKELFDETNLRVSCYKLNGEAELFYRKKSIKDEDRIIHKKNEAIANKNPLNKKKESCFEYDIIKDRRYTERQFTLHLPITINFNAAGTTFINDMVRTALKNCNDNYVIGIDRGERNLIYVSVINEKGELIEQESFNMISNTTGSITNNTDYHELLDRREGENKKARENWKTISGIKDLKEGYISQVVHKICLLVEKYDAVIAMEDLNAGFKNSRAKVEKQVYQKFEKMLTDKLNLYINKTKDAEEVGGLLAGYQLTNVENAKNSNAAQNGFIFYVPAWLTSKIDPTTGFVNLLNTRYESIEKSRNFVKAFDSISYDAEKGLFKFDFDYSNFDRGSIDSKKKWTVYSYGKRIVTFRNPEKNNQWDDKEIDITNEMKSFFERNEVDYLSGDLRDTIVKNESKQFYVDFLRLISYMLQMRNSKTGTEVDYLISPVMNSDGKFYCSDDYKGDACMLPKDADANGAYHIAKKALWAIKEIKKSEDIKKAQIRISNKEWLEYVQGE